MKFPHSLSDRDLMDYAENHIHYEIDMLNWSVGILASLSKQKIDDPICWTINNGILNTFAIHARSLIEFLYSRSMKKDHPTDIIINDYVDESDISSHLIAITPLLKDALRKANKQVAHLSMERINYETTGKGWKVIEVGVDINDAFSSIAPYISIKKMSKDLREKLSQKYFKIPVIGATTTYWPNGQENGICLCLQDKQILS